MEGKNPKGNILCLNVVVYIYTYTYINVELCQVKDQPEAPLQLAPKAKVLKIVNNSGQVPTFLFKY